MNQQAAQGDVFSSFILLGMLFIFMYFFLLRPQNKKAKEHQQLIENIKTGDEITTTSGIMGKIHKMHKEGYVELMIAKDTIICVQRNAIMSLLPKGTVKSF